ncbi:unnamed protein product [Medioppia subpectinata]|uniref:Uncharacterized protein n=1 Tax=Medioppia subpectinata TaxID=1979941 RepID=A0A7R9KDC1_9ACAR|nr:unnamed protein product [Medioppia subpectinata]CAG2101179.1 unnamed protein product [Medioppia subpectinata]
MRASASRYRQFINSPINLSNNLLKTGLSGPVLGGQQPPPPPPLQAPPSQPSSLSSFVKWHTSLMSNR